MSPRKVANPLALAVLATLSERPMHPYHISSTLKQRHKHESIRLNYGSLYSVVAALEREGLIAPHEVERAGRRPERTVYTITPEGLTELQTWLHELLAVPTKEYTHFAAGLSLIARFSRDEALELLTARTRQQSERIRVERAQLEATTRGDHGFPLPRIFLIESEYELSQLDAERVWLEGIVEEIRSGSLPWPSHRHEEGKDIITMPDGSEVEIPQS